MQTRSSTIEATTSAPARVQWMTAAAWIAGGALWMAGAVIDADRGWRFYGAETAWLLADLLLLRGLLDLGRLRAARARRAGRVGYGIAVAGRVVFVLAEILLTATKTIDALLPLGAVLTAIGMTAYGIGFARSRTLDGAARWTPLAMGVYPFVTMFPILAITGGPNILAIGGWGAAAVVLGLSLRPAQRGQRI